MTAPGETDVFFISIEEGAVVRRVELADIIQVLIVGTGTSV